MTELQMGLLGLGGAAVVAVVAYNKWQDYRHRKLAEQLLKAQHIDVLLDEREGGEPESGNIDHMKKGDMAKEAERLLSDTGWLPEPLRLASIDGDQSGPDDQADTGEDTALPDFLTEDGEDEETDEDEVQHAVAAE